MIYEISHRTSYRYESTVTQSQHLIHLAPRASNRQAVQRHMLLIEPTPTWRHDFTDYFGNPTSALGIDNEHNELVMHARSTIEVSNRPAVDLERGKGWDEIAINLASTNHDIDLDVAQYALPSPATATEDAVVAYAEQSFSPGRPVLAVAWDLTCRIYDDFTFDSQATDVSTPVVEVLKNRRGVCQDFAHLALACLRAFRIPARYVSGYILTRPPPGMARLQGADASHAWISVWAPEAGWVDFDPTNKLITSDEHITYAYGREFADISPVSGVLLGGGQHEVDVAVDVVPIASGLRGKDEQGEALP
ncbi:MAG: transglutaminase family protein [Hyphomicrobiaceae bacterium]